MDFFTTDEQVLEWDGALRSHINYYKGLTLIMTFRGLFCRFSKLTCSVDDLRVYNALLIKDC